MKKLLFILLLFSLVFAETETLRPNATGDETSITSTVGSAIHWENVAEVTADDAISHNWTESTSYVRDLYNLPVSSGSGTINNITVYIRWFSERTTNNFAKVSIKSGSTVTDGDIHTGSGNNAWNNDSQVWTLNPDDVGAWEWADIDALQIGVSLTGIPTREVRITQVYVIVDYTPITSDWTGTVGGVTNPAKVMNIDVSNIFSIGGVE